LQNRRNTFPIILLLWVWCTLPAAFSQTPKYSNEFLTIGVGARALGMSNAFVSVANDATSGYWNPAGLTHIDANIQVALMHTEYFAGLAQYDYGTIAFNLDEKSAFGFTYLRFGIDDIPDTSDLIDADGNINYDRIRSFSASDNAFMISYARILNPNLRIGVNTKIIRRTAGSFAGAWGFGLDAGIQYQWQEWNFGLMGHDITSTFNAWSYDLDDRMREVFTITGNEIPQNSLEVTLPRMALGASRSFLFAEKIGLLASADLFITTDGKRNVMFKGDPISVDPALGLEVDFKKIIFLRAGIGNYQQYAGVEDQITHAMQLNMGVGVVIRDILAIDYALTDVGDNSIALYSNVFSLRFNINRRDRDN